RDRVFLDLVRSLDQTEHGHVPIDVPSGSQHAAKILRGETRGLARMYVGQFELRLLADRDTSGGQGNHYELLHHSLQRSLQRHRTWTDDKRRSSVLLTSS